jgi:hypothetical protein
MSMNRKLQAFVRDLDQTSLEELRQSIDLEMEGREQKTSFKIDDIHPHMTASEKEQAASEIARVLKERG